jgi:hypothetical protein
MKNKLIMLAITTFLSTPTTAEPQDKHVNNQPSAYSLVKSIISEQDAIIEKKLRTIAEVMGTGTPKKLNNYWRIDDISVNGTTLTNHMTVLNIATPPAKTSKATKDAYFNAFRKYNCVSGKKLINYGAAFEYRIYSTSGEEFLSFKYDLKTCS